MRTWPALQIPAIPGHGEIVRVHDTSSGALVAAARDGSTEATIYACGITPYDATHIGHAATYVAVDLLQRALRDQGLRVRYASNVTDLDDPLLERAAATRVDWRDLAAEQTALFGADMAALGVIPPDVYAGVVESIPATVVVVERMLADGAAYRVPLEEGAGGQSPELGDLYADLGRDDAFGRVANLPEAQMLALFTERGGDPDRPGKRHPLDPLLWRRERPGEPRWDGGSLGTGRPGWHIECAVIASGALGPDFDVQAGGSDLLFPHHEMSGSHLRAAAGATATARVHVHAGMVSLGGEKMSKSRGNLVFVSALRAAGVEPMAIRLALLAHHYRSDWEWTGAELTTAEARLERWRAAFSGAIAPPPDDAVAEIRAALAADLDAPGALTAMDAWADRTLAGPQHGEEWPEGEPGVMARAVDALLGVRL